MARGIAAFVMVGALVLSISLLTGIGYFANVPADLDGESHNDDVQRAAENLKGIEYDEDRSQGILQGPLAAVIPFVEIIQTFSTVIFNTSGILQLLFGLPAAAADTVQIFFQIGMTATIAFAIRGILL